MPYVWLNNVLCWLGCGALVGAVAFVAATIIRGKGKRKRPLLGAGWCLAAYLLLGAANYALIFLVQLPSLGREQLAQMDADRADRLARTSLVRVGDPMPDFTLADADGSTFSMVEAKGKVVLINFFATWCGPCLSELPHIERIWADYRHPKKFQLLVIGREESMESVRDFRSKNGYSFPIAADPDRAVYSLFAKESIPRTLVVSPDGRIVYSKAGFHEDDLKELNAVLQEQFASLR
jgi:peroxiredoxin